MMKRQDVFKTAGAGPLSRILMRKSGTPVKPGRLKPGDTVALAAPAGIVFDSERFRHMHEVLSSFGFNVIFGEFVKERYGYFAGRDEQRAADLNRFFSDPEVAAILAVRGGWGSARILPWIDFDNICKNPKVFCGFSDNTTLHLALLAGGGLVSFHGPNGNSEWSDMTKASFKSVLMDGEPAVFYSKNEIQVLSPGRAEGRLIGGNLSILTTSLGTPYQPDTNGSILFLEEINEPAYKIDRMLTHLAQAGLLDHINGFIFGRCTNCPAPRAAGFGIAEVIRQHIVPLGIPAVIGMDIGHEADNFTIPQGVPAQLDAGSGLLKLKESAVE